MQGGKQMVRCMVEEQADIRLKARNYDLAETHFNRCCRHTHTKNTKKKSVFACES